MTLRAHDKMVWDGRAKSRLKKLVAANATYAEIAKILGCSRAAVGGQVHRMGLVTHPEKARRPRAESVNPQPASLEGLFFNGEPLTFAIVDRPCARCAVRESVHYEHGCGQFAAEVRVRIK